MRVKIILVPALAAVLLAMGLCVDRLLSRPSRINLVKEKVRLMELNDAILTFTLDRERFPTNLPELIPGYASEAMMSFLPDVRTGTRKSFLWNPETGTLACEVPFRIRGLAPREETLVLHVESFPVERDVLSGKNVFKRALTQAVLGEDDIVVEAERFQSMTYGWEIGENEAASGNCYIHLKEGVGDETYDKIVFDPAIRSGDFYNIAGDRRSIEARCYFMAPRKGSYFVAVRTMAHRSSCSNMIRMKINDGSVRTVGRNNSQSFVWLWHDIGKVALEEGLNVLSFMTYQDDVKVDQVVLTAKHLGLNEPDSRTFSGGYQHRPPLSDDIPPVTLSLSLNTRTVTATNDPEAVVYVSQNTAQDFEGKLHIGLDNPGHRKKERLRNIKLTDSDVVRRFPCEIALPRPLEKKEYLLRCRILAGSEVIQERTAVLFHGYDWSILGPLPFMNISSDADPEKDVRPATSYTFGAESYAWRRYDETNTDHFCLLDFGRMFAGRPYHAPPNVALYAYTEVEAGAAGDYLLKAEGDDDLVVWINGKKVVAMTGYMRTAIRSALEIKVRLNAGRNRILFRLNQHQAQWQAGIRLRTADDNVADVTGIPFARQEVEFYR